ncbi:MAG: acyl carrier protein [Saccharofermentanaceae bacterium]|jgi:acyl carrier protein|nr:acyl carrier protein [Clostridia bacterium]NLX67932.1 acyl carrier protein [Clostridiaceae bacterium]HOO48446.1 acyl carrier protein [Saccharofermentans sp.]HPE27419.1 acyl carrier protein [Saccharofermentans sp.]HPG64549.1 acyl carrier protein [Saccharofermentans sp.]
MNSEEIFGSIKMMIVNQLGVDENNITTESSFVDDLNADSLDMVELVMAMEQEFDISIPDEVAEKVSTVGDAVEYIKGLISK